MSERRSAVAAERKLLDALLFVYGSPDYLAELLKDRPDSVADTLQNLLEIQGWKRLDAVPQT